jgi:hypothetical protein
MVKCATKQIEYYAVVTDEEDGGDVYEVFAIVYHPDGSPAPYNASDPYWGPYFKYKVVYEKIGCDQTAIDLVNDAYDAGLITFGPGYDLNEITNGVDGELDKCTAALWRGTEIIDYEQPAGEYQVDVYAVDTNNNPSLVLTNYFDYIAIAGIEIDFDRVVYGSVNLNSTKKIAGDITWDCPMGPAPDPNPATVRNIGNTYTHVRISQSDMGFGKAGSAPGTAISSKNEADMENSNWNVYFGARMGTLAEWLWYDPNVTVTLDEYLCLSTQDELDFAIRVKNGFDCHDGTMVLTAVEEPFTSTECQGYESPCTICAD